MINIPPYTGQNLHIFPFSVEEIIPLINIGNEPFYVNNGNFRICHTIAMGSPRLLLFKNYRECVVCGLKGNIFIIDIQISGNTKKAHLNLYHIKDGILTLMTKDHIIPRSRGGKDHQDNLQVMCRDCNQLKGSRDISIEKLKEELYE